MAAPWEKYQTQAPAAAPSGPPAMIYGAPKTTPAPAAPTPFQIEDQAIQRTNAERSALEFQQKQAEYAATHNPDGSEKPKTANLKVIPGVSARGMQENMRALQSIDAAAASLEGRPESIGPGTGFFGDTVTQYNDPQGTDVRAGLGKIGATLIHDLSGAAVTLSEYPRLVPFVPQVTDRPEIARDKIKKLREELAILVQEGLDFYSPTNGYLPYDTPSAQAFKGGAAAQETASPPPAMGEAPQDVRDRGLVPGSVPQADQFQEGGTERVTDPTRGAMVKEYRRRLAAGQSGEELVSFLQSAGIADESALMAAKKQARYRQRFPKVPIEDYPVSAMMEVPLSGASQAVNAATQSAPAAYAMSAGNAFAGNNFDSIAGATGGNAEQVRLGMGAMQDANPWASGAGTITGLVGTAVGAEAGLARAGMQSGLARVGGANALAGFYNGTGGTDYNAQGGEASIFDRVTGGAKMATVNALAGVGATAGLRALSAASGPVVRAGVRAAGGDKDIAINQVGRALREDGITPRQAGAKIADAQSRGSPMSLADVGENTRELAASVGRSRGEARSVVRTVTRNRQEQQMERISSAVRRDLGPTANIRDMGDELIARAKDESAPLYDDAFAAPGAGAVSEKLSPILRRPSVKGALVRAERIAREEGRDPTALGFNLNAQGEVVLTRTPSWETLHYIKTGLDDVIESYRDTTTGKLVLDAEGRLINATKNRLLSVIDDANPAYKGARGAYAGPASMKDALQLGRGALSRSPDDVAANIKNLGPAEMEMYRLGLRKGIVDMLGTKGDYADKVRSLIGTPKSRAVLTKVLGGSENYQRFIKTLDDEQQLGATYQAVNGNSATAGRIAFDESTTGANIAGDVMDIGRGAKTGGIWGAAVTGVEKVMQAGKLGPGKVGDKARADIARLLSESDPDQLREIARMAQRAAAKQRLAGKANVNRGVRAGTVGAAIAGAVGQGTTPGQ